MKSCQVKNLILTALPIPTVCAMINLINTIRKWCLLFSYSRCLPYGLCNCYVWMSFIIIVMFELASLGSSKFILKVHRSESIPYGTFNRHLGDFMWKCVQYHYLRVGQLSLCRRGCTCPRVSVHFGNGWKLPNAVHITWYDRYPVRYERSPTGTKRNNNVIMTSKRRRFDVIITLLCVVRQLG